MPLLIMYVPDDVGHTSLLASMSDHDKRLSLKSCNTQLTEVLSLYLPHRLKIVSGASVKSKFAEFLLSIKRGRNFFIGYNTEQGD